jgi:hypothetical protein
MVTSVNDIGTYHLAELDVTRIAVPVAGKRVKAFKKREFPWEPCHTEFRKSMFSEGFHVIDRNLCNPWD